MAALHFNWVDYTIVSIILVSILISLIRGFVREALSLATWIIALWLGIHFAAALANVLAPYIKTSGLRIALAFFVLFAATLIVGAMVNFLIYQFVKKTGLSGTDRTLGMVFGLGRGVLIIGLLIMLAGFSTVAQEPWWQGSMLIPRFSGFATWLQGFMPANLAKQAGQLQQSNKSAP